MSDYAVIARNLAKSYERQSDRRGSLKELFVRGKASEADVFWALRGASFEIPRGSTFALVGHNGSGKSTALKLLAGIHRPTEGEALVDGRVSALLELGAGFHAELTGRENIFLNGAILGLTKKQILESIDRIVDFSGIGDFIDSPVKTYSSGMYIRLGFAIAVTLDPEILIVDEVIAVGDEEFQRKCFDYLHDLRRRGTTIVVVTHALGIVEDLCDGAVWLDHGRVRNIGAAREIVSEYLDDVNQRESSSALDTSVEVPVSARARVGSGEVRVTSVTFHDGSGAKVPFLLTGEPGTVRVHYRAKTAMPNATFGVSFLHESGVNVAGPNSGLDAPAAPLDAGEGFVDYHLPRVPLQSGSYAVSAAIVDRGHVYDIADREFELRVRGHGSEEPGLTRFFGRWSAAAPSGPDSGGPAPDGSGSDGPGSGGSGSDGPSPTGLTHLAADGVVPTIEPSRSLRADQ